MAEYVVPVARLLAGLLAGIYLAYAVSVMPALRRLDDATFTRMMNTINVVIVNPLFVLVFIGAPVSAVAVLFWQRDALTLSGALLGLVTLLVTVVRNIPLNDALAAGRTRQAFEGPWVRWNVVRTGSGIASLTCLLLAG
jgi:uncharacterized membrane protein